MSKTRSAAIAAAIGLLAVYFSPAVRADDYPSRTVKVIVPFGAGGPTDVFTRAMAQELQKTFNQTFVMENRPGAGTTIGTEVVAKASPDGYTLLMVSGTQTVNETLYTKRHYKLMRDLVPVAPLIDTDLVLVVHPSVPANNLQELLALARQKPGVLNYGSSGPGSNYHMAAELLKNITGIDIVHVPYKGSTGARGDILSGQIQLMFDSVPTMASTIKTGLVRAIATTGKSRSPVLPGVPTMDEAGAKGFHASLWTGVMAPAGTPKEIIDKLNKAITEIQKRPDIVAAWEKLGAEPLTMSPEAFGHFIDEQTEKWAKVIAANHIEPF